MRVFITGATGLLGSHLAAHLREMGHGVVALCRPKADTLFLRERGCTLFEGDVRSEQDSLAKGMSGCTHVVHAAALVYAGGEWDDVRAVNVEGTRNVLAAAASSGIGHAVHVSSVAVYGTSDGEVDESHAIDSDLPAADFYARSKREAEGVARGVEREHGLPTTVVRPSAVYGERDRLMIPAVANILRLPLVPMFGSGDNTLPVVYAGNVATAIGLALDAGRGRETFDVGRDADLTQRELFDGLAEGLALRPRFFRIPAGVVRGGVRVLTRLGIETPGAAHLPLDRVARLALGENPYPSQRIRRELGWEPAAGHHEALIRSGRWFANPAVPEKRRLTPDG